MNYGVTAFKRANVFLCSQLQRREPSENIRNAIIKRHNNSSGYRAIAKHLEICLTACNVIKKSHIHKTVKRLPGHGNEKKLNQRSLQTSTQQTSKNISEDILNYVLVIPGCQ